MTKKTKDIAQEGVDTMLEDIIGAKEFSDQEEMKKKEEVTDDKDVDTKSEEEDTKKEEVKDTKKEEDTKKADEKKDAKDTEDTDEKGTEKDTEGKDAEDVKEDEEDPEQIIATLRKTINELSADTEEDDEEVIPTKEEEESKERIKEKEKKSKDIVFITEEQVEASGLEGVSSEFLNKFANTIYAKAKQDVMATTSKQISGQMKQQTRITTLVNQFYTDNPDLNKFRPFVGSRLKTLASKHPDWSPEKMFEELGPDVRVQLGMRPKDSTKVEGKSKKPAFAKKPKVKGTVKEENENLSGQEKEVLDLIS